MTPPDRRLPGELAFALVMLLFGATALWQAYRISGFASYSSPGAVPMLAALVLLGASVRIVLAAVRQPPAEVPEGGTLSRQFERVLLPRVIVAFTALIALYMFALDPLGFVASSFLFLAAGMWVLGSRRIVYNLAISAVCLAAIYAIFQTAFSVVLPAGVLKGLL